jgi:hypothetical protein
MTSTSDIDERWQLNRTLPATSVFSSDSEIDAPVRCAWLTPELALTMLERRVRPIPFVTMVAPTRWFGTKRPIVVDDVVVEPDAGDRPRRAIPGLTAASTRGPLA